MAVLASLKDWSTRWHFRVLFIVSSNTEGMTASFLYSKKEASCSYIRLNVEWTGCHRPVKRNIKEWSEWLTLMQFLFDNNLIENLKLRFWNKDLMKFAFLAACHLVLGLTEYRIYVIHPIIGNYSVHLQMKTHDKTITEFTITILTDSINPYIIVYHSVDAAINLVLLVTLYSKTWLSTIII